MRSLALMLLAGTVAVACASRYAWTQETLLSEPDDLLFPDASPGELPPLVDESPSELEPLDDLDDLVSRPEPLNPAPFAELQQPPASASADSLRRQYLELQKRKAELMSEEQLQAALKTTDADILRLQAEKKLAQARQILQGIVGEYPNTEAANAAAKMLQSEEAMFRPSRDMFFEGGELFPDDRSRDDKRPRDDEAPPFSRSSDDSFDSLLPKQDNDAPTFRRN